MGGRGTFSLYDSASLAPADEVKAAAYDAEVNGMLQDAASEFSQRDAGAIRLELERLQAAIEADIDGSVDLLFGGSVRRHTYVDGLSDVDVLVFVDASHLAEGTPSEALDYVAQQLRRRVPGATVTVGTLAVTVVTPGGIEIQLLPALRTKTGTRIATADGDWSLVVRPKRFAEKLTQTNVANSGRVVPVIKLMKALQMRSQKDLRLKGYHVESLAIKAFADYDGRHTLKDMLQHLVGAARQMVLRPIQDVTGQSLHVDDYLGSAGSRARRAVSAALGRLASRLDAADRRGDAGPFRDLFED
jgi:hypothetical protein